MKESSAVMIIACGKCGTQYDGTGMQAGAQFQCSQCGALVTVPRPAPAGVRKGRGPAGVEQRPQNRGPKSTVHRSRPAGPQAKKTPQNFQRSGGTRAGRPQGATRSMGRSAHFQQAQKSNTGLYIGIGVGVLVMVGLVILVFTLPNGKGGSEHDAIIAKVMTFSNQNTFLLSEEEFQQAEAALESVEAEKVTLYQNKLRMAQEFARIEKTNQEAEKMREYQDKARVELEEQALGFFEALKAGKTDEMKRYVDARAYRKNIMGKGLVRTSPWRAPSNSKYTFEVIDESPKFNWGDYYSESELVSKGFEHLKDFYAKPDLRITMKSDDGGTTLVSGVPPGRENSTDHYLGTATLETEASEKALELRLQGRWGQSAKVVMIYDSTEKQLGNKLNTARIRNQQEHEQEEGVSENQEQNSQKSSVENESEEKPLNDSSEEESHTQLPEPPKYQGEEAGELGVSPASNALAKAVDMLRKGSNANTYAKDFQAANEKEKRRTLGACADVLLNLARQNNPVKEARVLGYMSEFIKQAFQDWSFDQNWIAYLSYARDGTTIEEYAWRYHQAYLVLEGEG